MHLVVMGVSGCGKTSVGEALGRALHLPFADGDDLHPKENIAKMSAGIPLTDADRFPWLDRVGDRLKANPAGMIIGCSALKRIYRDRIRQSAGHPVTFLHLAGSRALIESRMRARKGHFMPASLLDSQFATLEPPAADEQAITVSIDASLEKIVADALSAIRGVRT